MTISPLFPTVAPFQTQEALDPILEVLNVEPQVETAIRRVATLLDGYRVDVTLTRLEHGQIKYGHTHRWNLKEDDSPVDVAGIVRTGLSGRAQAIGDMETFKFDGPGYYMGLHRQRSDLGPVELIFESCGIQYPEERFTGVAFHFPGIAFTNGTDTVKAVEARCLPDLRPSLSLLGPSLN